MNTPEKLLELRRIEGLTQEALGKLVGITARAVANYEAGIREPDPFVCVKLALVSPNIELVGYFCQLADDPAVPVIVGRIILGDTGVRQPNYVFSKMELWNRDSLEMDPVYKWAWALGVRGKSLEDRHAAADSMGISLKILNRWIHVAITKGPGGFVSRKTNRLRAVTPETSAEDKLLLQLLTVLRSPAAKKGAIKAVIEEAYENLVSMGKSATHGTN